ncbi:MAG TPA: hypothetical protein VHZ51_08085 [Ktedonobacteraceae bacterium]|nr:hypothetical protein [Ktedonobacteraceae bacterium]
MSKVTLNRTVVPAGLLQIMIILLAVITGLLHLALIAKFGLPLTIGGNPSMLVPYIFQNMGMLFLLNCIGYIALVAALYLPAFKQYQRVIRWTLIIFTAITVVAYFALIGLKTNPIGYADKIIEMALIALLVIDDFQTSRQPSVMP